MRVQAAALPGSLPLVHPLPPCVLGYHEQHPQHLSTGLYIQVLCHSIAKIPRFFWTFLCFAIYTVTGREHFVSILSNFLAILSYWAAFFIFISAEEHFLFRQTCEQIGGYNLEDYDSPSKLLLGPAGIFAVRCGMASAVMGKAEGGT